MSDVADRYPGVSWRALRAVGSLDEQSRLIEEVEALRVAVQRGGDALSALAMVPDALEEL